MFHESSTKKIYTLKIAIGIEHPVESAQSAASGVQILCNLCNTRGVLLILEVWQCKKKIGGDVKELNIILNNLQKVEE